MCPVWKVRAAMGYLKGLQPYLEKNYERSIFDAAAQSRKPWELYIHGHRVIVCKIYKNLKYDILSSQPGGGEMHLSKLQIKLLYPLEVASRVRGMIRIDEEVRSMNLDPILAAGARRFVKNKSLFPLMMEREVVFFTLLEGEVIRGIIAGFSRYDITVHLKGGVPIAILRHAIYDLKNRRGRSFLKDFQEEQRDWEKSDLYVP